MFATLTQTSLNTYPMDVAVQRNGGVFYTDQNNIYYYFDDCSVANSTCKRDGVVLLSGGKSISALVISNAASPNPADTSSSIRYLYYSDLSEQVIRRMSIVYSGDAAGGALNVTLTRQQTPTVVAGRLNTPGMQDGPCAQSQFNLITDMEISQNDNGGNIYVLDTYNYRVRRVSTPNLHMHAKHYIY